MPKREEDWTKLPFNKLSRERQEILIGEAMKLSPEELMQAMKLSDAAGNAAKVAFIRRRLSQQPGQES